MGEPHLYDRPRRRAAPLSEEEARLRRQFIARERARQVLEGAPPATRATFRPAPGRVEAREVAEPRRAAPARVQVPIREPADNRPRQTAPPPPAPRILPDDEEMQGYARYVEENGSLAPPPVLPPPMSTRPAGPPIEEQGVIERLGANYVRGMLGFERAVSRLGAQFAPTRGLREHFQRVAESGEGRINGIPLDPDARDARTRDAYWAWAEPNSDRLDTNRGPMRGRSAGGYESEHEREIERYNAARGGPMRDRGPEPDPEDFPALVQPAGPAEQFGRNFQRDPAAAAMGVVDAVAESAPETALGMLATAFAPPAGAAFWTGAGAGHQLDDAALHTRNPDGTAAPMSAGTVATATLTGAAGGLLEMLPAERLLNVARRTAARMGTPEAARRVVLDVADGIRRFGEEVGGQVVLDGSQEGVQQWWNNLGAIHGGWDEDRDPFEGVPGAVATGVGMGGLSASPGAVLSGAQVMVGPEAEVTAAPGEGLIPAGLADPAFGEEASAPALDAARSPRGRSPRTASARTAQADPAAMGLELPEPLRRLARRELTSRGDLPGTVHEEDTHRQAAVNTLTRYAEFAMADLRRAVRRTYGQRITPEAFARMDEALRGERDINTLPEGVRGPLGQMRRDLEALPGGLDYVRGLDLGVRDPGTTFAAAVDGMGRALAARDFAANVRAEGLGDYLAPAPTTRTDGRVLDARITAPVGAARLGHPLSWLDGLYTTKENAAALDAAFNSDAGPTSAVGRVWARLLALTKAGKTVYNPRGWVRNFSSNVLFAVAQGHVNLGAKGTAAGEVFRVLGDQGTPAQRAETLRLTRLGILGDSARAEELARLFRDARVEPGGSTSTAPVRGAARGAARVLRWGPKLYRAGDDFWRVAAFAEEEARYRRAYPDWTPQQVEERAAEIVRNTYPTYSLVPNLIKRLRRSPLLSSFPSFPAEVVRTQFRTFHLIGEELSDPQTRTIGLQRLGGMAAAHAAMVGATAAFRAAVGITDDEDDAARLLLPSWSQRRPIVYLGQERPGVLTYTDAGYLNPYGYTDDPAADILRTLLRSDAPAEVDAAAITARTVAGLLEPFASEEMLTERVLDVSRNRTAEGAPVYNPEDPEAWLDISGHLWGAVEPSLLTDARRVLRGVEARGEGGVGSEDAQPGRDAAAMLTGARVSTLDVRRAVRYRLYDARERLGLAEDALRAAIRAPGTADEAAIRGAYAELETARREVIQEGQRVTAAARTLGVPEKDVAEIADLALSGVTSADRRALLGGPYAPRLFRPTWGQRGVDALNLEGRGVSAAEVARRLAILRSFAGTASADSTAAPDE